MLKIKTPAKISGSTILKFQCAQQEVVGYKIMFWKFNRGLNGVSGIWKFEFQMAQVL